MTTSTMLRSAVAAGPVTDGRTVEVVLCRWDQPERVSDDGRTFYVESFARGGLRVEPQPVFVRNDHVMPPGAEAPTVADRRREGVVVGRLVESHVRADGLYGTIRLADTDDGRWMRGMLPDVVDSLSVEFDDVYRTVRAGQTVVRTDAVLRGLVFTINPQRGDARVLAVRSHTGDTTIMDNENNSTAGAGGQNAGDGTGGQGMAAGEGATGAVTVTEGHLRSEVAPGVTINVQAPAATPADAGQQQHQRSAPVPPAPIGAGLETAGADLALLNRFESFGHYVRAAAMSRGDELSTHIRALHTGITVEAHRQAHRRAFEVADTSDIPGLIPPNWLTTVIDLLRNMTPTVQAFDSSPLPDSGLTITQPIVTQRPLVGKQAAESDEPASRKVTIGNVTWSVETFSGGDSMSIQSIERSDPAYMTQVMRLFVQEMGRSWNAAVAAGVLAAADDVNTTALEWTTAGEFGDLVIDAGAIFLDTLHRPAEVVGLSIGAWVALGKAKDSAGRALYPDVNPQNTTGTFDLTNPNGTIRKVSYFVEPEFGDAATIAGVIGLREAYRTMSGPMNTLTADTPQTLGRDVAVYQFGAHGKADATGLVLFGDAV